MLFVHFVCVFLCLLCFVGLAKKEDGEGFINVFDGGFMKTSWISFGTSPSSTDMFSLFFNHSKGCSGPANLMFEVTDGGFRGSCRVCAKSKNLIKNHIKPPLLPINTQTAGSTTSLHLLSGASKVSILPERRSKRRYLPKPTWWLKGFSTLSKRRQWTAEFLSCCFFFFFM